MKEFFLVHTLPSGKKFRFETDTSGNEGAFILMKFLAANDTVLGTSALTQAAYLSMKKKREAVRDVFWKGTGSYQEDTLLPSGNTFRVVTDRGSATTFVTIKIISAQDVELTSEAMTKTTGPILWAKMDITAQIAALGDNA